MMLNEPLINRIVAGLSDERDGHVVGAMLDTLRVILSEHANLASGVHLNDQLEKLARHAIRAAEQRPLP